MFIKSMVSRLENAFRSPPRRERNINRPTAPGGHWPGTSIVAFLMLALVAIVTYPPWLSGYNPPWWEKLEILGGAVIVVVGITRIVLGGRQSNEARRRLVARGDACIATIVSAKQMGAGHASVKVAFCLRVRLSDGRDVEVQHASDVDNLRLNDIVEGGSLNVIVDPTDPSTLLIEW